MDIVERLNTVREGMEAGLDDWPIASQIYEYKTAAEEITKLRETITAQAAVIEKLRESLRTLIALEMADAGATDSDELCCEYKDAIRSYNHTDSTQILDEVRKQERERVAQYIENQSLPDCYSEPCLAEFAEDIRAME